MMVSSGLSDPSIQNAILCYFRVLSSMFVEDQGWYKTPDYGAYRRCFRPIEDNRNTRQPPKTQKQKHVDPHKMAQQRIAVRIRM